MRRRLVGALLIATALLSAVPVFAQHRNGCQWCRIWTDSNGSQSSECVNWFPGPDIQPGGAEKLASCVPSDTCYWLGTWYCYAGCDGYQCFDV